MWYQNLIKLCIYPPPPPPHTHTQTTSHNKELKIHSLMLKTCIYARSVCVPYSLVPRLHCSVFVAHGEARAHIWCRVWNFAKSNYAWHIISSRHCAYCSLAFPWCSRMCPAGLYGCQDYSFYKNLEIACCESVQVQVVHHVSLCYITIAILAKQLSAVALINVYHYTSNGTGMYEVE